jgi:hypothetical protein
MKASDRSLCIFVAPLYNCCNEEAIYRSRFYDLDSHISSGDTSSIRSAEKNASITTDPCGWRPEADTRTDAHIYSPLHVQQLLLAFVVFIPARPGMHAVLHRLVRGVRKVSWRRKERGSFVAYNGGDSATSL